MTKLVAGVLLWSFTHFVPGLFPGVKRGLVARIGENPYKGVFTLLTVLALYLVVSGWKAAVPESLYLPPTWGRHLAALLMLAAFPLFFAPYPPNNIRRALRHPQLTAVALWSLGHLLANGELRSVVLFGGLGAWALLEMLLINRRDGARAIPPPAPRRNDVLLVIGGLVFYVVVAASHQWLFGFSPFT